jgi:methionine sulfoxide reductase heme-binding subunit
MHLVASTTTWYAARAGGVVAYLLVSACVLAGILLAGKRRVPGLPRFAVEDVHRFLGILAGVFIAIHIAAIALDTVVQFSLTQLVVPFSSSYRPLATGLGIVAAELLLAVSVTNRLRSHLPYRIWRRAHYATLGVWLLATIHGILSGTDRGQTWLLALYAVTVATVVFAMALRFGRAPRARRFGLGLAATGGALAAVLGLTAVPQQASSSTPAKHAAVAIPEIAGDLTGQIDDNGSGIVSIRGTAASSTAFRIDLLSADGRVADNALQLRFSDGTTCEGTLTALDTTGFTGTCPLPGGGIRTVHADWTVSSDTVTGTISTDDVAAATSAAASAA